MYFEPSKWSFLPSPVISCHSGYSLPSSLVHFTLFLSAWRRNLSLEEPSEYRSLSSELHVNFNVLACETNLGANFSLNLPSFHSSSMYWV
nr:hypothetical protein [Mycoplasmopsis bovis]